MTIKEILKKFEEDGVNDFELKKENEVIIIGYFKEAPIDCVEIKDNRIVYTCFSRQEKLDWLFNLIDTKTYIIDDYFIEGGSYNE